MIVKWTIAGWNAGIIILSLLPAKDMSGLTIGFIPHFDKIAHFVMYFVLVLLMCYGIVRESSANRQKWIITAIATYCIGLGFFLEIFQNCFNLGRSFDIFDVLANITGVFFGILMYRIYNH